MAAFKAKDDRKKGALNYIISQIKNKQIEAQRELEDDEVIAVIKKEIKSRQESIGFYQQANKLEDVAAEQ
ncbi:GatB/YqeY domain-containing protein [Patescibacteria group bacterium]|nr:GatB/YqeY domain-containing protein [Patescibacteria group bacterium]